MKIGFTIDLGHGDSMRVDSSEKETWQEAMAEVAGYLRRVQDPRVQQFAHWLLTLRMKEDDEEELPKEGEQ